MAFMSRGGVLHPLGFWVIWLALLPVVPGYSKSPGSPADCVVLRGLGGARLIFAQAGEDLKGYFLFYAAENVIINKVYT